MTITEAKKEVLQSIRDGEHEMEAGYPYENPLNDRQRQVIAAYHEHHGTCWLGLVNPGPQRPIYWEYDGRLVYNFGASFVVPRYDWVLDALLNARLAGPYTGTRQDYDWITLIHDRIDALGGDSLIWN